MAPYGYDLGYFDQTGALFQIVRNTDDGQKLILDPAGNPVRTVARGQKVKGSDREHVRLLPSTPDRVDVIRRIFGWYTGGAGLGFKSIADRLNREGVVSPKAKGWASLIGAYVHGNEPGHHIAYLYNWSDRPWRTQSRVRGILDTMYGTGPSGLCGNDDAGQMSAWYVLSALGFYPVCPGSPDYALGSPLVSWARVRLENGRTLEIRAENQSAENVYVQRVELDGRALSGLSIAHADLVAGGTLVFTLGPRPAAGGR